MTDQKNDPVRYIKRLLFFLTFIFLIAGIACIIHGPYVNKLKLQQEHLQIETEIKEIEQKSNDIVRQRMRFKNDIDFVKHIAREMGLVCPHEVVFQFVESGPR